MPRESFDETRLAAARLRAAQVQPFLALALYALTPIADSTQPTFSVNERWHLHVNPERLTEWSVMEVAGVLLHEVGHLIRDHAGRARTMNVHGEKLATLWNFAADAEINDDLVASGIELPGGVVTPAVLGEKPGMLAEYYYSHLRDGKPPPDLEIADCGSGCHGVSSDPPSVAREMVAEHAGLSDVEAMLLRKRTAEAIAVAVAASGAGSVAGGWARWAEALLRPQLDWRTLLGATVRSAVAAVRGNADYSYQRPSRRRVPRVVLPAMQRPVPRVAIVIDTSGSVDDDQLAMAWTEVHGCLRRLGTRRDLLSVYAADVDLHKLSGKAVGHGLAHRRRWHGHGRCRDDGSQNRAEAGSRRGHHRRLHPMAYGAPTRPVIVVLLPTEWGDPEPPPPWAKVIEIPADKVAKKQRRVSSRIHQ